MTLSDFLEHFRLMDNPFRGEEARTDAVFARMRLAPEPAPEGVFVPPPASQQGPAQVAMVRHAEFDKILGEPGRPAASVVFGEKGSGKTAIRLQIAQRLAAHNASHPAERLLLVPYDDINGVLARLHERLSSKTALESFQKLRLVDHLDALLGQVVPPLVDAALGSVGDSPLFDFGPEPRRALRRLEAPARRDLLLLQGVYDRAEQAPARTRHLRRALGLRRSWLAGIGEALVVVLPVLVAAGILYERFFAAGAWKGDWAWWTLAVLAGIWTLLLLKKYAWDRLASLRLGRKLRRQIRVSPRGDVSYSRSLRAMDELPRALGALPVSDSDDTRYAMLERLLRVLRPLGFAGLVIVVDRVDEPSLVSGDPERMRAIVWPMLNNKFLQHPGLGIKLLLPLELRHLLYKESSAFFQEARLDKQNLVDRLAWTGAMLYDLCDARLAACRPAAADPITLRDLFAPDVTREDLVEALAAAAQPRDAFKLLYRCITEHCSAAPGPGGAWQVPRATLELVRRLEAERLAGLQRGIRPG